jgi:hypothetical protein
MTKRGLQEVEMTAQQTMQRVAVNGAELEVYDRSDWTRRTSSGCRTAAGSPCSWRSTSRQWSAV